MVDDIPIYLKKDQLLELSNFKLNQPLIIHTWELFNELLAHIKILQPHSRLEEEFFLQMVIFHQW